VIRKIDGLGKIYTIAGTGETSGSTGDGGKATSALLNSPKGVAIDSTDNLYISECENHVIRKIDNSGYISLVAGNYTSGSGGDGGDPLEADLNCPYGMYINSKGDLYFADSHNSAIRKISGGTISTVAGIVDYSKYSGDGGPATSAGLYYPAAVILDSQDNMYISDTLNSVIRKVFANGTITTIAGASDRRGYSGDEIPAIQASLYFPGAIVRESNGSIVFVDTGNHLVRTIDSSNIIHTTAGVPYVGFIGDGGPAINARFYFPISVITDQKGDLYISDNGNHVIRKIDSAGVISTVVGQGCRFGFHGDGGPATSATLNDPYGIAFDSSNNLYIADSSNNVIRRVDTSGTITTFAGGGNNYESYSGDGGLATGAKLLMPYGVSVDSKDNVYIADSGNNAIRKVDTKGIITTIAGSPYNTPSEDENLSTGAKYGDGGLATAASLNTPYAVAVDSKQNVIIADSVNYVIRKIDNKGIITTIAGKLGEQSYTGDGGPATEAKLFIPAIMFIDEKDDIYFPDRQNNVIRKVYSNGTIVTLAGTGDNGYSGDGGPVISAKLNNPFSITFGVDGNTYIADTNNHIIRSFKWSDAKYFCYSHRSTNRNSVCSGKGLCIKNNVCKCETGHAGHDCSKMCNYCQKNYNSNRYKSSITV
jgi:sugar lactone lactonase YvrE